MADDWCKSTPNSTRVGQKVMLTTGATATEEITEKSTLQWIPKCDC